METFLIVPIAAALVVATVFLHYEILRGISWLIPSLRGAARVRMLLVICGVLVAHLLEIGLYAVSFAALHGLEGLGAIEGQFDGTALDFFYFSATSYTTLGVGDLYPHGALRLIAGIEALNGFVLIGWSASFTYVAMEKFWDLHRAREIPRR